MAATHFEVKTDEWDERSYVQGLHITPNGTSLAIEADPAPTGETFEVHATTAGGDYLGKARVGFGHGSNVGLEITGADTANLWHGNERAQATGYAPYRIGQAGTLPFVKVPGLPYGDVAIDQAVDLIVVRVKNRYRGFKLSAAKAGTTTEQFDFEVPAWGKRWQGMVVVAGRLLVHRDVETKGSSRVHVFDLKGRPVPVVAGGDPDDNWFDTSRMGDEAEGLVVVDEELAELLDVDPGAYVVKRTGGTGPARVIEATRLPLVLVQPKPPAIDPSKPGGIWRVLVDQLAAVDHRYGDRRDPIFKLRPKGYTIDTGDRFVTAKDSSGKPHTYLVTKAGYRYALSSGPNRTGTPYLRKVRN